MMTKLVREDESYAVIGAAMEVYNQLGSGFLEAVYQEAMELELAERGIPFVPQPQVSIQYKGKALKLFYIPDFVVFDSIIVESKAIQALGPIEDAQLLNYLKATGFNLGLLVYFGKPRKLDWSRRIYTPRQTAPQDDRLCDKHTPH